jgi:hypothetical protein
MTTRLKLTPIVALTACVLVIPCLARAQDERLRVSFAPALATVSGDAELALGGTVGYRVSKNLWFEGDLTWVDAGAGRLNRDLRFGSFSTGVPALTEIVRGGTVRFGGGALPTARVQPISLLPLLPGIGDISASIDGSTLIGTMGVRWEFPVETVRFRPYVSGGIGLNHTDQRFRLSLPRPLPEIDESFGQVGHALSAGTGVSIRVAGQVWADVDAKYFHLSNDRNIVRFGGGVTYRF